MDCSEKYKLQTNRSESRRADMSQNKIRVTVWNEYIHERELPEIARVYPNGIHETIGAFLSKEEDVFVRYATLDMPEQGVSEEVLSDTDVLIWWGHAAHEQLTDENARRVAEHVQRGMGFIALHSAHFCKPLRMLLGTTMTLKWKHGDKEKLFTVSPFHPIAEGIPEAFELEQEELYGEYFDIPKPDDVIFEGWFAGGAVFRSGVTFARGNGKIFYFQPGHEEYPVYYNPIIQKIIVNAVRWARPTCRLKTDRDNMEVTI